MLGLTFKENCPDLRNSKVIDMVRELQSFGADVLVHDPIANSAECEHEYGVALTDWDALPQASAIVAAVSHKEYAAMGVAGMLRKLVPGGVFTDVKSAYDPAALQAAGCGPGGFERCHCRRYADSGDARRHRRSIAVKLPLRPDAAVEPSRSPQGEHGRTCGAVAVARPGM